MWILNENDDPEPCDQALRWADFMRENRIVKQEMIGTYRVSTVFLGIDHNFTLKGQPILWESMIFNEQVDGFEDYCARYSSLAAAKEGHEQAALVAHEFVKTRTPKTLESVKKKRTFLEMLKSLK